MNLLTTSMLVMLSVKLMFNKNHIFLTLLWLEILSLFFIFSLFSVTALKTPLSGLMMIFMLATVVCEASVALACLVLLSRNSSSMMMSSLTPLKC